MNTFGEKVVAFTPLLDAKFQLESKTSFLEINPADVQFIGARQVKYPQIDMDGMVNYDRVNGFAKGGVKVEWKVHELEIDRNMGFEIDVMDDDELLYVAFVNTMEQFLRTKVVPEIDAYRFATMYGFAKTVQDNTTAVIGTGTPANPQFPENKAFDQIELADNIITGAITKANSLEAYDDAEEYFDNEEIAAGMCVLFVNSTMYKALKQAEKLDRNVQVDTVNVGMVDRKVLLLDGTVPVVKVPKSRFKTVIELLDDLQGGETGFTWDPTAVDMNFMMVHRSSVDAIVKHSTMRYFAPGVNQDADAHKMQYRVFHDMTSRENKRKGIYVHKAA